MHKGFTLWFTGLSGSGKSSLVQLVQRFHDATGGSVRVDGQDVREFASAELRRRVAIVPQHSVLFTGTLRENLLWGDSDATDERIGQALAVAQAADFVNATVAGGVNLEHV